MTTTTKATDKAAAKAMLLQALEGAVKEAYKTGDDTQVHEIVAALRKLG